MGGRNLRHSTTDALLKTTRTKMDRVLSGHNYPLYQQRLASKKFKVLKVGEPKITNAWERQKRAADGI